jgi:hypothetical protein
MWKASRMKNAEHLNRITIISFPCCSSFVDRGAGFRWFYGQDGNFLIATIAEGWAYSFLTAGPVRQAHIARWRLRCWWQSSRRVFQDYHEGQRWWKRKLERKICHQQAGCGDLFEVKMALIVLF